MNNNLLGNVIAKLINAVLAFVGIVILSRLLGTEGNAYFSIFIVNTGIAILVIGLGIENAITYFVSQANMPVQRIFNTSILMAFLQAAIVLLIAFVVQQLFVTHNAKNILQYTQQNFSSRNYVFAYAYLLFNFLQLYLTAIFNGEQLFAFVNKSVRFMQIGIIAIFVVAGNLLQKGNANFEQIIETYILLQAIIPAYLLYYYFKNLQPQHKFTLFLSTTDFRKLLLFAGFSVLINSIQFLAFRADIWILDFYDTKSNVGIYALGQRLVQMYWMVPIAIASITYPMLSRTGNFSTQLLVKTTKIIVQIWFYLSVITFFVAPFFTRLFFGKPFKESANAFLIILPGALLFIFATMLAPYFSAKNKLINNFIASLSCMLIIIILDFILIPKQGMYGAAIASSIGYGVTGLISLYLFCKAENLSMGIFFTRTKNIFSDIKTTYINGK